MNIESWAIALIAVIFGGLLGYFFTKRHATSLMTDRADKLKTALFNEFKILNELYLINFPSLLDDYIKIKKDSYSSLPKFDLSIVNALILELSITDKQITFTQRQFIEALKNHLKETENRAEKRDTEMSAIFNGHKDASLYTLQKHTALMLGDAVTVLFHTSKLFNDKDNFIFTNHKYIDYAEASCRMCDIKFNKELWETIIEKTGFEKQE